MAGEIPVLTEDLQTNTQTLQNMLGKNPDVVLRRLIIHDAAKEAAMIYIEGLVDKREIHEHILMPLMKPDTDSTEGNMENKQIKQWLITEAIPVSTVQPVQQVEECMQAIFAGNTVLLVQGIAEAFVIGTGNWETRPIEEPITESVIRGPREGFVESIRKNTAIIRRKIKDPNLVFLPYKVGRRSQKDLYVVYIKEIANQALIDEVKSRIERIDIDGVEESGYVEQLIEENYLSPFSQTQNTERPDRVVQALLEGRVAILLDGTPFVLLAPVTFSMLMSSPEDYYERWIPGSLIRLLRYIAVFLSLFLPALYISFISYNHGMIPTKLAISISASREGVPFPSIVEAFIMEVTVEILREAGIRLPKTIGQAVGIVGALVIGQAAVEAGIVSPITVIVVSLTAISSFSFPQYGAAIAIRIMRFSMMIAASFLGLFGVILMSIFLIAHLVKLKSFGVSYLAPFAPIYLRDWKDGLLRLPFFTLRKRTRITKPKDSTRR